MIAFLFCLMILDYVLTKYGMSVDFIREGNPLMQWLMNLPFVIGLTIKVIVSAVLLIPFCIAKKKSKRMYKYAMFLVLGAYCIVYFLHMYWIYWYLVTL
jgi:riboflavin transporter FmnP